MKWAFQAYSLNEYKGLKFSCDDAYGICYENGEQIIALLSFDKYKLYIIVIILFSLFTVFHLIAFSCLKCREVKYLQPKNDAKIAKEHRKGYATYKANIELRINSLSQ